MIVWEGLGFLVAVIVFGCALACNLAFDAVFGKGFYEAHLAAVGVAMLLAASLTGALALWVRQRTAHVVIDKETGQEFILDRGHSLLFIPVRFWSLILTVVGIGLCVAELL